MLSCLENYDLLCKNIFNYIGHVQPLIIVPVDITFDFSKFYFACKANLHLRSDISNKKKHEKIFLRRLSLSRFLSKTLRVNKITMKKSLKKKKNCRSEAFLNCRPRHSRIQMNTHDISCVRSYVNINYVCM